MSPEQDPENQENPKHHNRILNPGKVAHLKFEWPTHGRRVPIGIKVNEQSPEQKDWRADGSLVVHSLWNTVQGEGPLAGFQAVFVRLAGCNLQCPLCDTEYTKLRDLMTADVLAFQIGLMTTLEYKLVVITGGEPFRQNISPVVNKLLIDGFVVQVETNGTFAPPPDFPQAAKVVCCPKTPKIHPKLEPYIDTWKYVLRYGEVDDYDGLPTTCLGSHHPPARPEGVSCHNIYLQPCDDHDEKLNRLNIEAVVESGKRFGYRIGVQLHKVLGLP